MLKMIYVLKCACKDQPKFFQNSANDSFHEAIGDTIVLSVTPKYLKKTGLIVDQWRSKI